LPQYYFELVNFSFFKTTDLLGFREFVVVVSNYNTFYYAGESAIKYDDSVSVAARIRSANHNFFGEVKDHLLLFIFAGLTENATGANAAIIQTLYEYLAGVFNREPKRIERIHKMRHEYEIINKPLPSGILSQQLKTPKGKFISLRELLGSNEVIYLSFWANSCELCIADMQLQKQLMAELEGKSVKFIFISFDEDEKKWQKALSKLKMKGVHYFISEGFESEFAKYISFHDLPRYLIFDKQDRLVSHEAPGPGSILKDKSALLRLNE
jgi:thiol-disulfide isomerase/thioredoxin